MMTWERLLSAQRFKLKNNRVVRAYTPSSEEGVEALRSDFLIDYDRVVFSSSFRRMGRKTQVHPFAENDYTHNRLTHSVEVASVGRSIGNQLAAIIEDELPPLIQPLDLGAIVQVAGLAHDLGNPPFGHTGEEAIRAWFLAPAHQRYLEHLTAREVSDLQAYEGNAHTIRIVTNLEMYRRSGGMRLTAASIGALVKYPWTSDQGRTPKKFNFYQAELPLMKTVFAELGLKELGPNIWARHPLSYLMEAADDICYAFLDLEDAIDLGVLSGQDIELILHPILGEIFTRGGLTETQYCRMLRGKAIGEAVKDVAHTFVKYKQDIMAGEFKPKDLLAVCRPEVSDTIANAKQLAREKIFRHPNKIMTEIAAFPCLGSILSLLVPAVQRYVLLTDKKKLATPDQLALELLAEDPILATDTLYGAYMKVMDFVGGLTDNAAAKMAREVSGIGMIK